MSVVAGAVTDRDLRPRQCFELGEQDGLVTLGLQQQVRSAAGDMLGMAGLGVHGVGDEQDSGKTAQHTPAMPLS